MERLEKIFSDEREARIAQGLLSALRPRKKSIRQFPLWEAAQPEIGKLLGESDSNPRDANYQGITERLANWKYIRGTGRYRHFNLQTPVIMTEEAKKFYDRTYK